MTINKLEARQNPIYSYISRIHQIHDDGFPAGKECGIDRDSLVSRFVIFDHLSAMGFVDMTEDVQSAGSEFRQLCS